MKIGDGDGEREKEKERWKKDEDEREMMIKVKRLDCDKIWIVTIGNDNIINCGNYLLGIVSDTWLIKLI